MEGKWAAVLGLGASRCAGLLHFASWATGLGKRGRGKGLGRGVELAWADGLGWEEGLRVGLLTGLGWVGYWAVSFLFSIFQPHSNYLNSNLNLNSTLALKQIKQCTSMNAQTSLP